mmetsp:Transcript_28597/g.72467  ORF Transcript_28597/g.72467 Transcript_28597/m.72467 type:complete len:221 (+) Transcript_28597:567-1229(+)
MVGPLDVGPLVLGAVLEADKDALVHFAHLYEEFAVAPPLILLRDGDRVEARTLDLIDARVRGLPGRVWGDHLEDGVGDVRVEEGLGSDDVASRGRNHDLPFGKGGDELAVVNREVKLVLGLHELDRALVGELAHDVCRREVVLEQERSEQHDGVLPLGGHPLGREHALELARVVVVGVLAQHDARPRLAEVELQEVLLVVDPTHDDVHEGVPPELAPEGR